tara:strand:+ start:16354 stop:16905 length:552 start_codon:yes stop_codon:yes gene_type:complete
MEIINTPIKDVVIVKPKIFEDNRGYFLESYNKKIFNQLVGKEVNFIQDNQSKSSIGTLRGIHYQIPPASQAKLVSVLYGEIYDVAVDLRRSSATFCQYFGKHISADNKLQMWIPEGFGHGFLTLSDHAIVSYKVNSSYSKIHERTIKYNDDLLKIQWPSSKSIILSDKDKNGISIENSIDLFD